MTPAGAADTVLSGPLLAALLVAALAGLVSFASPCVLPLVPAYLAYATGMSGADLAAAAAPDRPGVTGTGTAPGTGTATGAVTGTVAATGMVAGTAQRGRLLAGSVLFVLGFSAVFVSYGALFGGLGGALRAHQDVIVRVLGVVMIGMGLLFAGRLPALAGREWRLHPSPHVGLAGAPLLGITFGIGWTPCIGPTLAAVQALAFTQGSAGRGALLSLAYCLGLGLPFMLAGLAYGRALAASAWVRRHQPWVLRLGGGLLVLLGLLLVTGVWGELLARLQGWVGGYVVPL